MRTDKKKTPRISKKSHVINFGRHKGQTIGWIVDLYPSYILWLDREGIVKFSKNIVGEAVRAYEVESSQRLRQELSSYRFMDIGDLS